jgi:uncharacterized protein
MSWTWDPQKNRRNKRVHGISFETAVLAFEDPLVLSRPDPSADEERWQTIGLVGPVAVVVIHTWPEREEDVGRIISARRATAHERKAYEQGTF